MALDRFARYGQEPPSSKPPSSGGGTSTGTSTGKFLGGVSSSHAPPVQEMWTPSPGRSGRVGMDALRYMSVGRPRYTEGAEFTPAAASPMDIVRLQREMWAAGLYDKPIDHVGVWSGNTVKAYKKLLEYANSRGVSADRALVEMKRGAEKGGTAGAGGGGGEGSGGAGDIIGYDSQGNPIYGPGEEFVAPALELKLPNKKELETVVRQSVIDQLGVGWSQQEVSEVADNIIAKYRQIQTGAYNQQVQNLEAEFYGRPMPNPVIESVDVPDPQMFVEEEARRRDPAGAQATDIAEDFAPAFFEALGGYT